MFWFEAGPQLKLNRIQAFLDSFDLCDPMCVHPKNLENLQGRGTPECHFFVSLEQPEADSRDLDHVGSPRSPKDQHNFPT